MPRSAEYDLRDARRRSRGCSPTRSPTSSSTWRPSSAASAPTARTPGASSTTTPMMGIAPDRARPPRRRRASSSHVGTICAYPKFTPVPFREEDLWNGYPEETNAPYGLAKKMLLVQAQAYRQQYGFNAIYLLPVNLYGPGDNFDPETSHVIPALIRKFVEAQDAGAEQVDAVGHGLPHPRVPLRRGRRPRHRAGDRALRRPRAGQPGRGRRDLDPRPGGTIAELIGLRGRARWDATKPDGQPRRWLDTSRAKSASGSRRRSAVRRGPAPDDRVVPANSA